jgi:hypothetical protein
MNMLTELVNDFIDDSIGWRKDEHSWKAIFLATIRTWSTDQYRFNGIPELYERIHVFMSDRRFGNEQLIPLVDTHYQMNNRGQGIDHIPA